MAYIVLGRCEQHPFMEDSMIRTIRALSLVALTPLFAIACSSAAPEGAVESSTQGETWTWGNDPNRLGIPMELSLDKLPREGKAKKIAWTDTYWPRRDDSFNVRWQGARTLSPLEKYDAAFNGWKPAPGFFELRPLTTSTCRAGQWDPAYYQQLGPAATYWSEYWGNGSARRSADACAGLQQIPSWEGSCQGWSAASVLEEEPLQPVEINGVRFELSDIRALATMMYFYERNVVLGERCNSASPARDASGRIVDPWCRDTNAATLHVVMTNLLGVHGRAFTEDRVGTSEVWNQPVVGFRVTSQREISKAEANQLLRRAAGEYTLNPRAERFAEVNAELDYITERDPSTTASSPEIHKYVRTDKYHYVLELDASQKIVGGEWLARSAIPDFVTLPIAPGRKANPNALRWNIKKLLKLARPAAPVLAFENTTHIKIPDLRWTGVTSSITVSDERKAKVARVGVDINHSQIQDLVVTLLLDGKPYKTLFAREANGEDLVVEYTIDVSQLASIRGTWSLNVADNSGSNYGALDAWGISFEISP
jgi:hypothetical protein